MPDAEKEVLAGERKLAEGDFDGAMSRFKKAIKLDPRMPEAYLGKAEASLGIPKVPVEDVIGDYQKAIELEPDNPYYRARLGSFCVEVGHFETAEKSYNEAAERDPDNAYLYHSEFALEYFHNWMERFAEEATPQMRENVRRKALGYLLRSIDLDEESAKDLLP